LRDILLLQPEILLPDELGILCGCCGDTDSILRTIPSLAGVVDAVHGYQERFDGSGYPRRVSGGEIPLGAGIISIVHVMLDAMWKTRSYDFIEKLASARLGIQRGSGRRFDPEIMNIVLSMSDDVWKGLDAKAQLVH
jgi:response regulator RpfG family c-di-GMP phosphodiesterase